MRSRRHFCMFEMDNERYLQKRIIERVERDKMELRLYFIVLIPLTLFALYESRFMLNIGNAGSWGGVNFALHSVPMGIFSLMLLVVCGVGWLRAVRLALSLKPGGQKNINEDEWKKSQIKCNDLNREKEALDVAIQQKEIEYSKLRTRAMDLSHDEMPTKENLDKAWDNGQASKFSLRRNKDEAIDALNEHKKDIQRSIEAARANIETENKQIKQVENHIKELEIEYKKAKTVIVEFAIGFALIYILQKIPGTGAETLLAICAYITILALVVLYVRKYRKIFDEYRFEQNPTLYKSYAASKGYEYSQLTIKRSREEIFYYEEKIRNYEEKLRELDE